MKKISTLFLKDPSDLGRVIDKVDPKNEWAINGEGKATRKFDGTACAIINGELYKRYDVKKGKSVPTGAIPCQDPDEITGHWPHWVKCSRVDNSDKYHFEAFDEDNFHDDGTYELIGPKIQGNPEKLDRHHLFMHGVYLVELNDLSFEGIKKYIKENDIEGIVFHHADGRMCKIRKSDFGIKRDKFN